MSVLSSSSAERRIVLVGQTEPALSGQAVAVRQLLDNPPRGWRLLHVPINFSRNMADMGRRSPRKFLVLLLTILRVWLLRLRHAPEAIYYPPAGPDRTPVLRDVVLLLATRWCFRRTVFHFHAGGVMQFVRSGLTGTAQRLARQAYAAPDLAIRTAALAPRDDEGCGARDSVVVENAAVDLGFVTRSDAADRPFRLLFVGVLRKDKGVAVLVEAVGALTAAGRRVEADIVGEFQEDTIRAQLEARIAALGLGERIRFRGGLGGEDKRRAFHAADLLVFPTFFSSETFGIVLAEAMSCGLPCVATRWRGIPSVVEDGREGLLVPIRDPAALAEAIARLADDPALRAEMGRNGRACYEQRFTTALFAAAMQAAFDRLPS